MNLNQRLKDWTPLSTYGRRRLFAGLLLMLVILITVNLDFTEASGGDYRGGGRSAATTDTNSATEGSSNMPVPRTLDEVEEEGIYDTYQIKITERGDLTAEIRWFHPQTGELIWAASYDVKSGEYLGGYGG